MPVASRTALTAATTSPRASAATASGGSWKEFDDMARPRTDLRTAYGTSLRRLVTRPSHVGCGSKKRRRGAGVLLDCTGRSSARLVPLATPLHDGVAGPGAHLPRQHAG